MAGKLYCLESVTYLTAGLVFITFLLKFELFFSGLEDASQNPDIEVEKLEIQTKNNNLNMLRLKVL